MKNNIRKARKESGLSQKQVALELHVSPPTVSDWEAGKINPSVDNLISLSNLFRVPTDYLLGKIEFPELGYAWYSPLCFWEKINSDRSLFLHDYLTYTGSPEALKRDWHIDVEKPDQTLDDDFKAFLRTKVKAVRYLPEDPSWEITLMDEITQGASLSLSPDARQLASDYDQLDVLGRHTVRTVADMELQRVGVTPVPVLEDVPAPVVDISTVRQTSGGFATLHVYDQPAAAGLGNYIDEPSYHIEQYPGAMLPKGTSFGILISGDSMEPRIPNGSTVFVQYAAAIDPGEIGIFVLDGQTYCKQLAVDPAARTVALHSINPKYPDMIVDASRELRTIGRVLGKY